MENLEPYISKDDIKVPITTTILLSDRDFLQERGIPVTAAIGIGCKELKLREERGGVTTQEQLEKVAQALNKVAQEKTAIQQELEEKIRAEKLLRGIQ